MKVSISGSFQKTAHRSMLDTIHITQIGKACQIKSYGNSPSLTPFVANGRNEQLEYLVCNPSRNDVLPPGNGLERLVVS